MIAPVPVHCFSITFISNIVRGQCNANLFAIFCCLATIEVPLRQTSEITFEQDNYVFFLKCLFVYVKNKSGIEIV